MVKQKKKQKKKQKIRNGVAHIQAGLNNTIVTITDKLGRVISWSSAGACGFKGARKGTPFAAKTAIQAAGQSAKDRGVKQVEILISGNGAGRRVAIRTIHGLKFQIFIVRDITPLPHNGCRPPKKRRI